MSTEPEKLKDVIDATPVCDASGRRPVPPAFVRGEIRLHTFFFSLAAIILLMSILMSTDGETAVFLPGFKSAMPETCSSKRVLGIDCPGCGMTRAFISISHGQFARAWHLNHASFVVYFFVAVQLPWNAIQIWKLRRNKPPLDWKLVYMTPLAVVALLCINWVWKLYQTM